MNILINHFKAIHGVDTMSTAPYSTGAVWNRLRWRNINDGIWFAELHLAHEYIQRWLNTHLVTFPHGQFLQPFTTILFKAKSLVQLEMILRPLHFQHCASRFWSFLFGLDGFIFYIQHAMGDPAPLLPQARRRGFSQQLTVPSCCPMAVCDIEMCIATASLLIQPRKKSDCWGYIQGQEHNKVCTSLMTLVQVTRQAQAK